jgi:DNA-binding NarL/FixJ family response regulator
VTAAGPLPRVLLVEDQALVAMEFETLLVELGCAVIGPFGRVGEALPAARESDLAGAVLDVTLAGEVSFPVAFCLRERGIPFFFVTGLSSSALPEALQGVACLAKPIRTRSFLEEVRRFVPASCEARPTAGAD